MNEWQHGRRRYGPHCNGFVSATALADNGDMSIYYEVRFLNFQRDAANNEIIGYLDIKMHQVKVVCPDDTERAVGTARAACDAQVERWRREFPGLLIVSEGDQC